MVAKRLAVTFSVTPMGHVPVAMSFRIVVLETESPALLRADATSGLDPWG